jgi:hypothetical protein
MNKNNAKDDYGGGKLEQVFIQLTQNH